MSSMNCKLNDAEKEFSFVDELLADTRIMLRKEKDTMAVVEAIGEMQAALGHALQLYLKARVPNSKKQYSSVDALVFADRHGF